MTTQKRAKVGGEIGANGEHYEGGRFIATTARPKTQGSRPAKARKVEVEPFTWVTLEVGDNRKPLLSIVGTGAAWINRYDWKQGVEPYMPAFERLGGVMYNGETLEDVKALCDRWNAGERWM